MDAKDHAIVMNNEDMGKGRTEDYFWPAIVLFTRKEKILTERTDYANGLVLLSLTEFSL